MSKDTIITRAKGGTAERKVRIEDIQIPDCWHPAMFLLDSGRKAQSDIVLETWYLAHDLLRHIKELEDK